MSPKTETVLAVLAGIVIVAILIIAAVMDEKAKDACKDKGGFVVDDPPIMTGRSCDKNGSCTYHYRYPWHCEFAEKK